MPCTHVVVANEEQEQKLEALRKALIEGENSGPAQPFDLARFLAEQHAITEQTTRSHRS